MRLFTPKPGSRSAIMILGRPFTDIAAFNDAVQELVLKNPLGCTPYRTVRRHFAPVIKVRERYTARFVYENEKKKQVGSSSEVYDSADGYLSGIHAVMSNMANTAAHRGKARHVQESDRFSVILKCHDRSGELYFLGLARDRITVASFTGSAVLENVKKWAERSPLLPGNSAGRHGAQHRQ